MAKYSEIVALLEYMDKKSPQKQPKRSVNPFKKMKIEDLDIADMIRKKRENLERLEKALKDLSKKDDKKEEKKGYQFGLLEIYILGLFSYPLVGYVTNHLPTVLK